ncbi:protein aveugle [Ischnura elegans]|uniref:protein aveugle n=1 Tax=Ischnura elegans TaxID=197161 RepID=UPI001ED8997A|nr:protein aveugle [Ischnura elegans]
MKDTILDDSSNSTSRPKNKTARPRPVYLWTAVDVQKWFRRHCSDFYPTYGERFLQHDITGRTLVRVNESTLLRLGVLNPDHRQEIWREIMKLKLKTDILEIRDLERRNNTNYD